MCFIEMQQRDQQGAHCPFLRWLRSRGGSAIAAGSYAYLGEAEVVGAGAAILGEAAGPPPATAPPGGAGGASAAVAALLGEAVVAAAAALEGKAAAVAASAFEGEAAAVAAAAGGALKRRLIFPMPYEKSLEAKKMKD
jgi:hypothetical protein